MQDIRVAAVCMQSLAGEVGRNLETMRSFVSQAAQKEAAMVLFPELSITGYVLEKPAAACPPSLFNEATSQVLKMAKMSGVIVVAGVIETLRESQKPYITEIIASPEGSMGLYRKTHLSPPEQASYNAGKEIGVYRSASFCFGMQLCYESHFPEISTCLALQGAEAIFMPHASPRGSPEEKAESWSRHLPSRAFDNGLYVIACNQVGENKGGFSFPGVILAIGPSGRILEKYCGTEEEMVLVDMKGRELEEVRTHRMKYFLPHRRPELYKEVTLTKPLKS